MRFCSGSAVALKMGGLTTPVLQPVLRPWSHLQIIGLKMEVGEDEFADDREGLGISADINTHLSQQVRIVWPCHPVAGLDTPSWQC